MGIKSTADAAIVILMISRLFSQANAAIAQKTPPADAPLAAAAIDLPSLAAPFANFALARAVLTAALAAWPVFVTAQKGGVVVFSHYTLSFFFGGY